MGTPLDDLAYNVDEAFELAAQIEKNGAAFYVEAAKKMDSKDAVALCLELAECEVEHVQVFDTLRKRLVASGDAVESYDSDETVVGYLKAIAGHYVFNLDENPEDLLGDEVTVADILRIGIDKERDSIVLYLGMIQAARDPDIKEKIGFIMREEQRHLMDLTRLLNDLKAG